MSEKQNFTVFDHYQVQKELAKTENSVTYLASAIEQVQHQAVIKVMNHVHPVPIEKRAAVDAYIKALLSLQHPSIVPLFDIIVSETQVCVVRAYLPHFSLDQRLQTLPLRRLAWEDVFSSILSIGRALIYAHEHNITHGNIKPENVLYDKNNEAMLTDFSFMPMIDLHPFDLCTAHYMAPEQFMGQANYLSDQYALACLAYEMLVGHPPFEAQNVTSLWNKHANESPVPLATLLPDLPESHVDVIMRALMKKPDLRYPTMDVFLQALASGVVEYTSSIESHMSDLTYSVDIDTSLFAGPGAQAPQEQEPFLESTISASNAKSGPLHIDPYNETLTMFVVGDLSPVVEQHDVTAASAPMLSGDTHPLSLAVPSSSSSLPTTIFTEAHTNRLFWPALLLLLGLFVSTCLVLLSNQPSLGHKLVFRPRTVATVTSAPATHTPQSQELTPRSTSTATPVATPKTAHNSGAVSTQQPEATVTPEIQETQPTPLPVTQPTAQSITQPSGPSFSSGAPWWGGGYDGAGGPGIWRYRSPFLFPSGRNRP